MSWKKNIGFGIIFLLILNIGFGTIPPEVTNPSIKKPNSLILGSEGEKKEQPTQIPKINENSVELGSSDDDKDKDKKKGKIIGYGKIFQVDGKDYSDKLYKGSENDVQFESLKDAQLARQLGAKNKDELNEKVKEVNSNPIAKREDFKLISEKGYANINKHGYKQILGEISTRQKSLDTLLKDKSVKDDDVRVMKLKKEIDELQSTISTFPPDKIERAEIITSMNEKEMLNFVQALNEDKCGSSFSPTLCEIFLSEDEVDILVEGFTKKIQRDVDKKGKNREEYNKEVLKEMNKLVNDGFSTNYLNENCPDPKCETVEDYQNALDKVDCGDDKDCKTHKRQTEALVDTADGQTLVETNFLFSVIDVLNNYDRNAMAASKLFGWETELEDLPKWLQEEDIIASQICLSEFDGYLDEESSSGGAMTKYSSEDEVGYATRVVYDVRAMRTQITPDNKTQVTLSYYVSAPKDSGVSYMLGLGYKGRNGFESEVLVEKTNISAEGIGEGFETFEIDVKGGRSVEEDSFFVYLKSKRENGEIFINNKVYTLLITQGTKVFDKYSKNDYGNRESSSAGKEEKSQKEDAFWNDLNY